MKRLVSTIFAAAAFVLVRRRHLLVARADPQLRSPRLYLPLELTSQGRLDIARRLFARTAPTAPPVPAREEFITSTLDEHPIRAVVYDTHERPPNSGALLWIHGGGMVMGAPEIDHQLCSRFAAECGVLVVSVDYRLAPEHPFPTPLVDCHDVLRWLHDHADRLGVDASRIAVGGASAGGGLAASLCQFARDRGGPAIAFQLLQYPMLDDRTALRRDIDASGTMAGLDTFTGKAFDMVTSGVARDALNLEKESKENRERYKGVEGFLTARRLVEAGVGCVTLSIGGWDTHSNNFTTLKRQLPMVDRGIANLVQDLHDRGMADDVAVVMWGEFGRTPKVNGTAGRDHWSPVMSALVAGGGLKMGQAVGSSTARGERPKDRPYRPSNLLATLYNAMGIDPAMTFNNGSGRPVHLLEDRNLITELA